MTPEAARADAERGELRPVYLVVGEERYLADEVVRALRTAAVGDGPVGFNEDRFTAGEGSADDAVKRLLGAVRMLPMMGKRRLVLVRNLERWDRGSEAGASSAALDALAEYAAAPSPSTCLVLSATKLDGRGKLAALAKKADFAVVCAQLERRALPAWIVRAAKSRGHAIDPRIADLLAEVAGPELSHVADAIERVGLYVGAGAPITEDAISACVVRMREQDIWSLVGAVGRRDLGAALSALHEVYDPGDHGLRTLGTIAWSVRQLLRFESATREGASPQDAAKRAGAPPFKANDLAAQVRAIPRTELERWLVLLAETDLALKGSRRPPLAVVETMLVDMCGAARRAPARA